jgi:hypothetical protein
LKEVKVSRQENMNTVECPFTVLSRIDCSWIGSLSEVMDHVMSSHVYETQKIKAFCNEAAEFS